LGHVLINLLEREAEPQLFVFGLGRRIRQSSLKIDFSGLEVERGFWILCAERRGRRKAAERRFEDAVVPHVWVGLGELVRSDDEAAVRLDQDGRGGAI
jgi:hypothetical protein